MFTGKHFTTLNWVIIWGVIAVVANATLGEAGAWAAIVAAIFVVLGSASGIIRYSRRKLTLRKLFDVYYEQKVDEKTFSFTTITSHHSQEVQITLQVLADINCKFINLAFIGEGQKPTFKELYDHNLELEHPDFRWTKRQTDDSRVGHIMERPRRNQGDRIRIAIGFIASKPFIGYLEVFLSTEEGAKRHLYLSFDVLNTTIADHGDNQPENMTRLRWLNSTAGIDKDYIIAPYLPLSVEDNHIKILGRELILDKNGLPAQINLLIW